MMSPCFTGSTYIRYMLLQYNSIFTFVHYIYTLKINVSALLKETLTHILLLFFCCKKIISLQPSCFLFHRRVFCFIDGNSYQIGM